MDTKSALHMAYTGEAKAALRLKVYAEKADQEGYAQMAKLFRVIAFSEEIHGTRALKLLRAVKIPKKISPTASNLKHMWRKWPMTNSSSRRKRKATRPPYCISARARMWKKFTPNFIRKP